MKRIKSILHRQTGQALPMALVLLTIGAMVIVPTLILTQTNLNATIVIDQHTRELYAADAGIEHALWNLQDDARLQQLTEGQALPFTYDLSEHTPDSQINDKDVQVTISSAWLLNNYRSMPADEPQSGQTTYGNDHWTTVGALSIDATPHNVYVVNISTDATANVDHIGVWLPNGYDYVNNSITINGVAFGGNSHIFNPQFTDDLRGGKALIWSYGNLPFQTLSDITTPPPPGSGITPAQRYPPSISMSFTYTHTPTFQEERGFFPWIRLQTTKISWDEEAGFFHIQSTGISSATASTTVDAYVPRGLVRYTSGTGGEGSATNGDYIVIGNSLMTCCWKKASQLGPPCDYNCTTHDRGKYFTESYATINSNGAPSDAQIQKAYLFWTAWQDTSHTTADTSATLNVNDVPVGGGGTVTANKWYILATKDSYGSTLGYQYSCFADVTDVVKAITTAVNNTKFTVGGVYATPASSCSGSLSAQSTNAAWSIIIIYSSSQVLVHQIYLYDQLAYLWGSNGASEEFTILGFEAPATNRDAKVAYFIAEGDSHIKPDYFEFRGQHSANYYYLGDHNKTDANPYNNVYNSYSTATGFTPQTLDGQAAGTISGVDLDVYTKDKDNISLSNIVQSGDTWARILVKSDAQTYGSGCDGINVVFVIFSVTSNAVSAGDQFNVGTMLYQIQQ